MRGSSISGDQGAWVEAAPLNDGRLAVRNSNDPGAGVVFFTRTEMDVWIRGAKAGELDALGTVDRQVAAQGIREAFEVLGGKFVEPVILIKGHSWRLEERPRSQ
ncbi:DUF397 domain-containing protein [Streptomyces sp. NBC_00654]|uniref:DUF397 domain-containing protein n=1 Tax=Streptomyces sp. NBC_00654 TaxID=2975799 RepID=UPI0022535279|nr:DUF397 domain-containing protein [Streptomyces sp. NBC_00654]MCX4963222.1 DUF397 domain-containing protein [Streptomyces sp. NBC_00654]